ncbi:2,3-diketo-L-gulonate TRAP transporter small permease protein YiaM [Vibrio aerogenes CECT 7868]|uniref:TRAP transporter small permease protein n=1 Tax=Vibrio aerogenes CECT 7868 TaxID=1216006 RepID=A0A1M5XFL7_9VIBR|nr:TRAP transporter small permease subunit [Vibrio aerogenes]SHH98581.1 2,3-diketo-L-gulonate TRAP transporter small permease protein YiaM [Vibrio aerogenes CECT 7868]
MERLFKYLLTILIGVVAFAQFIQVITRYVFEVPVMGLEEMTIIPTLWMYMLGAVNASRENTQIRANVLEIFIKSEWGHTLLALIGEVISFVISVWLTYWAWDYFKYALRVKKETPTLYIPTLIYECSLFIGLVLISGFILLHIVRLTKKLTMPRLATEKV